VQVHEALVEFAFWLSELSSLYRFIEVLHDWRKRFPPRRKYPGHRFAPRFGQQLPRVAKQQPEDLLPLPILRPGFVS